MILYRRAAILYIDAAFDRHLWHYLPFNGLFRPGKRYAMTKRWQKQKRFHSFSVPIVLHICKKRMDDCNSNFPLWLLSYFIYGARLSSAGNVVAWLYFLISFSLRLTLSQPFARYRKWWRLEKNCMRSHFLALFATEHGNIFILIAIRTCAYAIAYGIEMGRMHERGMDWSRLNLTNSEKKPTTTTTTTNKIRIQTTYSTNMVSTSVVSIPLSILFDATDTIKDNNVMFYACICNYAIQDELVRPVRH